MLKEALFVGLAAGALMGLAAPHASAQIGVAVGAPGVHASVGVGAPTGPGWSSYRERRVAGPGWDGPGYYDSPGEHYGWYRYNDDYYQNCSYRWTNHHRNREWRCW